MKLGTIEGEVDTSSFEFRAVEDVGKFDFVSVKSNGKWILAQVEEVTKQPDGETFAQANIIGYRDKGLTKAPRQVIEPDSIVYEADQELIADTLGLESAGLEVGNLETNPDIDIFVEEQDFYKHFAVLAQTGAGKCVTPDTDVLMADGDLRPVREIFEEESTATLLKSEGEELRLLSDTEVKAFDDELKQTSAGALYAYRKKADEVLEITLSSGRKVEVTPEHPLLSAENGHSFEEARNLSEGEHIGVPRNLDFSSDEGLKISDGVREKATDESDRRNRISSAREVYRQKMMGKRTDEVAQELGVPKTTLERWMYQDSQPEVDEGFALHYNQKSIETPDRMSSDLAEFMSLVVAEGTEQHENSYRIIFTNENDRLLERFQSLSDELFGLKARDAPGNDMYVDSTALKRWLEEVCFRTLRNSREKSVPEPVMKADEQSQRQFLRTFYDCEGCMEDHEVTLTSASQEVASQIVYMLCRFGVVARIREKTKKATNSDHDGDLYYEVVVSGARQMKSFSDSIGFGMGRKQEKLESYLETHDGNTNADVVPIDGDLLKRERNRLNLSQTDLGGRLGCHSTLVSLYERNQRRPSRKKVVDLADALESQKFRRLAESDVFWDEIENIERKAHDGYVYDLTVREHHNFVSGRGGVICHNSYLSGVLLEELLDQDFPVLILDPHGEYSSLQHPNPERDDKARGFDINHYSPNTDVNSEALPLRFSSLNMEKKELLEVIPDSLTNSQMGVLYNSLKRLREKGDDYSLNDIMDAVSQEESTAKWNLLNSLEQIEESGLFSDSPTDLRSLLEPGEATVVNLKAVEPEATEMTSYLLAKRLFDLRKRDKIPPFVMLMEEAHNFAPEQSFGKALSSEILRKIASEGRKFGLGIGVISQRPARIDKNVLSQCNTQFILRVSNPNDLKAISKSFEGVTSEVESMITSLPPGVCFVLGNEYPVMTEVRQRYSKHGGETQTGEEYVEKHTVECVEPQEELDAVQNRRGGGYSAAYYPIYRLENDEKEMIVDGVKGEVKAERQKPSDMESKVLDKLRQGLGKSEIVEELELNVAKLSSIQDRLVEKGLVEDETLEPAESVLDIAVEEVDAPESDLIEFEVDESEVEGMLDGADVSRQRYPYYSKGETVYDPVLRKEL